MRYYLAIDIGASSGRHIVGWMENGEIQTEEVFRFPNGVHEQNGHLVWDIEGLAGYVKEGIQKAKEKYPSIESLSIDTWVWTMYFSRVTRKYIPAMPTGTAGQKR